MFEVFGDVFLQLFVSISLFAIILILASWYATRLNKKNKLESKLSIPSLLPSDSESGSLSQIVERGGMVPFLSELHELVGPLASFWWGREFVISVANPSSWTDEVRSHPLRPKSVMDDIERAIGGENSILFAEEKEFLRRRKGYAVSAFSKMATETFCASSIEPTIQSFLSRWETLSCKNSLPVSLSHESLSFSLQILVPALLGIDPSPKQLRAFTDVFEEDWAEPNFWMNGLAPESAEIDEKVLRLRMVIGDILSLRRRGDGNERRCLVDGATDQLDENKLIDDIVTHLIFGARTSARVLGWCIALTASHTSAQSKVRQELAKVLKGRPIPSAGDVASLPLTTSLVQETLRMSSPVATAARCSDNVTQLQGHIIPPFTPILHSLSSILMGDRLWVDPTIFDPFRFFDTGAAQASSYCPFGIGGPRNCPASRLVIAEITMLVGAIFQNFEVQVTTTESSDKTFSLESLPFISLRKK